MIRLALRTMRFRKGGFAATFIALFFGASMVMACGGLLETGVRTDAPPQRLAAADVVIAGNQEYTPPNVNPAGDEDFEENIESGVLAERVRLDRSLVETVRSVPGVADVVGDVSFPLAIVREGRPVDIGAEPLGLGWASAALAPYSIVDGAAPVNPGDIVLDRDLAAKAGASVGDRLDVLVRGRAEPLTVTGIAAGAVDRPAAFVADPVRFAGVADRVDLIGVTAAPGTEAGELAGRIDAALHGQGVRVLTGSERGYAEFLAVAEAGDALITLAAVIGGFAIMVAMFVVASTLGLSIQHRYRELALLRAMGTTPGQLRRMVLIEALVVALLATGLACGPGVFLGEWLFDRLTGLGVVPDVVSFHQGWIPMIVAVGAGLLTALVAGFIAARRAAATRPTEALTDAAVQRRWLGPVRLILALLFIGGGLALAIVTATAFDGPVAASTAGPSVMVWAIALALLAPGVTKLMVWVLRWPLQAVTGLAGQLAMLNARARTVRLAAAVTPIMLATGIATANIYLQTTQVAAAKEAYARDLRADVVLASTAGGGLPTDLIDAVRAVPGVAGASEFVTSSGFLEELGADEDFPLQGISADGAAATTAVSLTAGRLEDLRGNTIALDAAQAGKIGHGVGDTVRLRLGDGAAVDLRVVALFSGVAGFEKMLVPADLLAAHTTAGLPQQIMVKAAPGVDPGQLTGALAQLAAARPGVAVADRSAMTSAYAKEMDISASVNYLLVGMIMAYTAIAVVNTLVMATGRRRREFALQRLTGSTRGQVLRMMSVEAILVAAVGIVLGTIVSLTTLVPFSLVVSDSPMPTGPLWIYLSVAGVATLMALVATVLPTWRATRSRPAEAAAGPE